jgi:hypothetical protein
MNGIAISAGALVLALAACSGGEKAGNGQPTDGDKVAAAPAAGPVRFQPGEYESTTKLLEFAMPGMPQAQSEMRKAAMSGGLEKPHRYCLTEAEAAKGPKQLVDHMPQGACKTSEFHSDAGSIHGTMQCAFPGGVNSTTTFDGSFTSDGSTMTLESDQQMPGMAGKTMHTKMQVDTHRVGECSG